MDIKVNNLRDVQLFFGSSFGDWIDLAAGETVAFKQGDYVTIPLGIAVQLPDGHEAHILPRSSTFKNYGLLHASSGLIDERYNGDLDEWVFACYATRDGIVEKGNRVCQFRVFEKMPAVFAKRVNSLGNKSRGGFGSTGK